MDRILKGTNTLSALFLLMLALTISLNGNAQKFSFVTKGINRVQLGETYRYSFLAVDSSVKKITYSCNKLPDWITFDKETRTILGIPKNPDNMLCTLMLLILILQLSRISCLQFLIAKQQISCLWETPSPTEQISIIAIEDTFGKC